MRNTNKLNVITGKVAVINSPHKELNLNALEYTPVDEFTYISPEYVEDGVLNAAWTKDGYILLGIADVSITLIDKQEISNSAISALHEKKKDVQAKAQMAINELAGRIQNLLALPNLSEVELA